MFPSVLKKAIAAAAVAVTAVFESNITFSLSHHFLQKLLHVKYKNMAFYTEMHNKHAEANEEFFLIAEFN